MSDFSDHDFEAELAAQREEEDRLNAEAAGFGDEYDAAHPATDDVATTTTAEATVTSTTRKHTPAAAHELDGPSEDGVVEAMDLDDLHSYDIPPDQIGHNAIVELLTRYDVENRALPAADKLARQALSAINTGIERENDRRLARKIKRRIAAGDDNTSKVKLGNDERLFSQRNLTPANISQLLLRTRTIVNIAPTGRLSNPDFDMLAIYDNTPTSLTYGTYLVNETAVTVFARQLNMDLSVNGVKEVMAVLREQAPRRERAVDRDLIAVNNGIVNYKTKKLMPFTPDHIFLSKARINYREDAHNPICHNPVDGTDWDVESWMSELSDDPDVVELLWQIIGATIRPYVSWNKSAWFYSEQGNNGKGSLIALMRNLIGPMAYASIPLNDFSKDFALEPLTQASAILVDENDVGTFIDKAANLKAIITNDVISINRKFRTPISYQFHGFMVQCLNEFPKIKDKSESFYRRQLFVPFTKCFTGAERKYIKDDYLAREDVLEYVLWRVINMPDYYDFIEAEAAKFVLDEYKEFNDPVRAFWTEYSDRFAWDLLPFPFIYDLYKRWLAEAMPSSTALGRNTFIKDLVAISGPQAGKIADDYLTGALSMKDLENMWACPSPRARHRSSGMITTPEPIIEEAGLDGWINPLYAVGDPNRNLPQPKEHYSGLLRASVWIRQYLGNDRVDEIEQARGATAPQDTSSDPQPKQDAATPTDPATDQAGASQPTASAAHPATPEAAAPNTPTHPSSSADTGHDETIISDRSAQGADRSVDTSVPPAPETGADGTNSMSSAPEQVIDPHTSAATTDSTVQHNHHSPLTTPTTQEYSGHDAQPPHRGHPAETFIDRTALAAAIDELVNLGNDAGHAPDNDAGDADAGAGDPDDV